MVEFPDDPELLRAIAGDPDEPEFLRSAAKEQLRSGVSAFAHVDPERPGPALAPSVRRESDEL
jgi:hypothetical protein